MKKEGKKEIKRKKREEYKREINKNLVNLASSGSRPE